MKTVLYNPVFINPQAYYVFPQLYDIQPKTEDYIEQAIFVGKLMIQTSDSLEYKGTYENTKQIDLSDYAGKRIRISQFTDIGAVVLGEWILPDKAMPDPPPGYYYPIDFTEYFTQDGTYPYKLVFGENVYGTFDVGKNIIDTKTWTIPEFKITVTGEATGDFYLSVGYIDQYGEQVFIPIESSGPGAYTIPEYTFHVTDDNLPDYWVVFRIEAAGSTSNLVVQQVPYKLPTTPYLLLENEHNLLLENEHKIILE